MRSTDWSMILHCIPRAVDCSLAKSNVFEPLAGSSHATKPALWIGVRSAKSVTPAPDRQTRVLAAYLLLFAFHEVTCDVLD